MNFIIPPDWIPWILGALGLVIGLYQFAPEVVERWLGQFRPSKHWQVSPGTTLNGQPIMAIDVLGTVTKTDVLGVEQEISRHSYIAYDGDPTAADEDELWIPANALKKSNRGNIDIRFRKDIMHEILEENRLLKYRMATAASKAQFSFQNSLDFTSRMTVSMGEWKKNIGQMPMFGDWSEQGGGGFTKKFGNNLPEQD